MVVLMRVSWHHINECHFGLLLSVWYALHHEHTQKGKERNISQFNYLLPVLAEVVDDQAHP
jgi:hypothetical protein